MQVDGRAVDAATVFDALKGAPHSKVKLKVETLSGSEKETELVRMPVSKGEVADMKAVFDSIIQARSKILQLDKSSNRGLFDSRRATELMPILDGVFDAWSRSVLRHHARVMQKGDLSEHLLLDLGTALERLQGRLSMTREQLAEAQAIHQHSTDKIQSLTRELSAVRSRLAIVEEELTERNAELESVQARESQTSRAASATRLGWSARLDAGACR